VPKVVGSREGWELYIATGGVMVQISPVTIYSFHPDLLPTTLGTYLSRIMFESLILKCRNM
jgi:hypothetical protein